MAARRSGRRRRHATAVRRARFKARPGEGRGEGSAFIYPTGRAARVFLKASPPLRTRRQTEGRRAITARRITGLVRVALVFSAAASAGARHGECGRLLPDALSARRCCLGGRAPPAVVRSRELPGVAAGAPPRASRSAEGAADAKDADLERRRLVVEVVQRRQREQRWAAVMFGVGEPPLVCQEAVFTRDRGPRAFLHPFSPYGRAVLRVTQHR
ncbi:hypothetical protein MTO96_005291 [Rhipicephalus appendiculatus]